jgi:type IV secretory pathway VirB10-like protein
MTSASASRVTRSSRNLRLALVVFGCGLAVVGVLRAQEPPRPDAEAPAEATTEGTGGAEAAKGEAVKQPAAAESDAAGNAPPPKEPSPNRFEPTEKVRADFDVSFPIDI